MTSCVTAIQNQIAAGTILNLPQIYSNTATPVSLTQTTPCLLLLESNATQTVTFSLSGASSAGAGSPVNLLLTIYKYASGVATSVGSVNLTNANSSFQKDFANGTYIFCIASQNAAGYNGTLIGTFVGFPTRASMTSIGSLGDTMTFNLDTPAPPIVVCNQTIWYEIVDGKLPPGIILQLNGILTGVFPNLDCIDDEDPYSPAVNWFYDAGGSIDPVGRQWRFQVRAWLENFPDVETFRWFCIRIYNDWSIDRDNFLKQPKVKTVTIARIVDPDPLPAQCEPCNVAVQPLPVFEPIPELCPTCDVPEGTAISATSVILPSVEPVVLNQRGLFDLDALFLKWGNIINQENPLFTEVYLGEVMEVSIVTRPTT